MGRLERGRVMVLHAEGGNMSQAGLHPVLELFYRRDLIDTLDSMFTERKLGKVKASMSSHTSYMTQQGILLNLHDPAFARPLSFTKVVQNS